MNKKSTPYYLVGRSAKTGRFVPVWKALRYPDSHVTEKRWRNG